MRLGICTLITRRKEAVSDVDLYFERLKSLNLSFEESVYTIAFGLEDEIAERGKETVFSELCCREKMAEKVREVLDGIPEDYVYALRCKLGNTPRDAVLENKWANGYFTCSFEGNLKKAINTLRNGMRWRKHPPRLILAGGAGLWSASELMKCSGDTDLPSSCSVMFDVSNLSAKVQQLMDEVRFYNERRDQALTEIKTLLEELKNCNSCPENLTAEAISATVQKAEVVLDGPITQIRWPYRSLEVLRRLKIKTLAGAVEYFSDFDNFVNGDEMTLWEWSVIVAILRRADLLDTTGMHKVDLDDTIDEILWVRSHDGVSKRTMNCLLRADTGTIRELICRFSAGARDGWEWVSQIRNLGASCRRFLVESMRSWMIDIPPEYCYLTETSDVMTLDLSQNTLRTMRVYQIQTVGELMSACKDMNRFRNLKYIDCKLYEAAVSCLKVYGFDPTKQ